MSDEHDYRTQAIFNWIFDKTKNAIKIFVTSLPLPSGAATSVKQQPPSTEPTVYNKTLTIADTQYSQVIPSDTREIRFRCRTLYNVRYAWVEDKVATPTAPYLTLPAGCDYHSDDSNITEKTLYLASDEAGVVVEIEVWT